MSRSRQRSFLSFTKEAPGGSHTAFDNLRKSFKEKELGKGGLKRIDRIGGELVREGLLLPKPTHYGLQISLNPRQSQTITTIIRRFFPEFNKSR